ncbi:hypothetical protein QJS66_15040 [Kocuria rhizophila]|nr:hypothetical protein QJS66_15040 [Kocuria rhizophila]
MGLALANSCVVRVRRQRGAGHGAPALHDRRQTAIARYAADRDLDKGFGGFTAAFSAGQMIGPALGGWIVGHGSDVTSPSASPP